MTEIADYTNLGLHASSEGLPDTRYTTVAKNMLAKPFSLTETCCITTTVKCSLSLWRWQHMMTTRDVCGNDVGGPLGHPLRPLWSAVNSSGIRYNNICTAFIRGYSTVKRNMLADCRLMSAIRRIHTERGSKWQRQAVGLQMFWENDLEKFSRVSLRELRPVAKRT